MKKEDTRNLTDKYIYELINRYKVSIKMAILRKYPLIIQSVREMQLIKRANNIKKISRLNVNLNFNGDKILRSKSYKKILHQKKRQELSDKFVNKKYLNSLLPENNLRDFTNIIQIKRSQILLKREIKSIKTTLGEEKICNICGSILSKDEKKIYHSACKTCKSNRAMEYAKLHIEKHKEYVKKYGIKQKQKIKQNEQSTVI